MPYCFVPRCQSGSKAKDKFLQENGLEKSRFFSPGTEERRSLWESLIKRGDCSMTMKSRVCNEHFTSNDFELFYETKLADGTIHKMPRGKAKLKDDAVPSQFPQYPQYYQPKLSKRKMPVNRGSPKKCMKVLQQPEIVITEIPVTEPEHTPPTPENQQEQTLLTIQEPDLELQALNSTWSCQDVQHLTLPINWVIGNTLDANKKFLVRIDPVNQVIEKSITFIQQDQPILKIKGITYTMNCEEVKELKDAQKLLNQFETVRICAGTGFDHKKFSTACEGGVRSNVKRCKYCMSERGRLRKIQDRKDQIKKRLEQKKQKRKSQVQSLKRSRVNLINKVRRYRIRIENAMRENNKREEEVLKIAISKLPPAQQEAVRACFEASKRKGPSGRRYTTEWVYECMLMRIKDTKLYEHIRMRQILTLPSRSTINGYLRNYGGAYGFQPQTLEMLKVKTADMNENLRRGMILIDEMKLTEGIYFDASTLKVTGFVDMGEDSEEALGEDFHEEVEEALGALPHDPNAEKKRQRRDKSQMKNQQKIDRNLGNHALVISFQPFMGKWVQAIACFLTRGNATDDELTKLILEAVLLLEKSGLRVDGVVNDGAKWNRSMWLKFGIDKDNVSAEHPCNSQRRLFFISDFPHLMKCMRNCLSKKKIIKTPTGDVKLEHWEAVLEADSTRKVGLRECHKLTKDHLHPNPWQKMNVRLAWQFWSASAAAAMVSYQFQGVEKLEDCEASVEMCKMINELADAMNSSIPSNAMRLNSPQYKAIENFLEYFVKLKEWADNRIKEKLVAAEKIRIKMLIAEGKKPRAKPQKSLEPEDFIFSDSTDIGLIVTLKGSLELVKFLIDTCKFRYVMTARFNQDALERFFGMVRQSAGCNSHPEPRVFAQLFRLLSIYSLVKPCRGSNITGGEMITTLLNLDDLKSKTREERKKALSDKLDEILINGENLDFIPDLMEQVNHDHNYILGENVDEFALSYVSGFVARHSKKWVQDCEECKAALQKPQEERSDVDLLITQKSKGYLTYPSDELVNLMRTLEETVINTSLNSEMEENILFTVLENLEKVEIKQIGCSSHNHDLTKSIMKFYLITRMHFLTRRWNERTKDQRKKQRDCRKEAHLT